MCIQADLRLVPISVYLILLKKQPGWIKESDGLLYAASCHSWSRLCNRYTVSSNKLSANPRFLVSRGHVPCMFAISHLLFTCNIFNTYGKRGNFHVNSTGPYFISQTLLVLYPDIPERCAQLPKKWTRKMTTWNGSTRLALIPCFRRGLGAKTPATEETPPCLLL